MFPRPLCPKCETTTIPALITTGPSDFDIQTFECPACANVHQIALVDPLTSAKANEWLAGQLKALT
jgi:hypothetical protein